MMSPHYLRVPRYRSRWPSWPVKRKHFQPDRTELSVDQIMSLLKYCLTTITTCFQYDGQLYKQLEGATMGSLVSPITAYLFIMFMEDFETKLWPPIPTRLGSADAMLMIPSWSSKPIRLTASLSTLTLLIQPSKFTIEKEVDNKIPVLDVLISREKNRTT